VISSTLIGCISEGTQPTEIDHTPDANLDSIFSIGDSILVAHYIKQAQQKIQLDSLASELCKKKKIEQRERIIYRDTVIYQEQIEVVLKTITDTIYDIVYVTDTMNATVSVAEDKKKHKKKESQE
tara:strand:- start:36154 stop:36528 length:375 start_codon:yes stop_codon:yes gene_type:complete